MGVEPRIFHIFFSHHLVFKITFNFLSFQLFSFLLVMFFLCSGVALVFTSHLFLSWASGSGRAHSLATSWLSCLSGSCHFFTDHLPSLILFSTRLESFPPKCLIFTEISLPETQKIIFLFFLSRSLQTLSNCCPSYPSLLFSQQFLPKAWEQM